MSWRDHCLDFDQSVIADKPIWRIAVFAAVEKSAVVHIGKRLLLVKHSCNRLLFCAALHVVVAKSNLGLAPVKAL